jgi:hypothetical protein
VIEVVRHCCFPLYEFMTWINLLQGTTPSWRMS